MKRLILFILIFLCLQTVFGELPRVAVVEIKAADKGVKSESLTKYLRSEFTKNGKHKYRFVSQEEYRQATLKMQGKTQDLVNNQKYRTEYGNLTSANLLLITEIDCEGNDCTIYSTLINIKGEDIDSTHENFLKNIKQSAHDALSRIVAYLVKQSDTATTDSGDGADGAFCRQARHDAENGDMNGWRIYKDKFPNGACADEAEETLDKKGCEIAKQKNTVEAWKKYLEKHPDGKCTSQAKDAMFAAEYAREKAKKLRWSDPSSKIMNWNEAQDYCNNLGTGWRLPTVDELRTLITDNPKTETGGLCKVSEKGKCLSKTDCWAPFIKNCVPDATPNSDGSFNIYFSTDTFFSSSFTTECDECVWIVDTLYGGIFLINASQRLESVHVRCVR